MKVFLDLFSGIGGFALGAYWAGLRFDNHYFSEVDDYAIPVYSQRFPEAIGLGDITKIDGTKLPQGDWIIAGGFPCQDISVAGKGAGLAGSRSGLWFEYARLIGDLRPRFAVMENVSALTFRGLGDVLGSLSEIGYDAEWADIRASDVGAPHRRERIWIVAYPRHGGGGNLGAPEGREGLPRERTADPGEAMRSGGESEAMAHSEGGAGGLYPRSWEEGPGAAHPFGGGENVADAESLSKRPRLCKDGQGGFRGRRSGNGGSENDVSNTDSQGLQERDRGGPWGALAPSFFSNWWAVEPSVGRVVNGLPARVDRLKCLGNSIVPQISQLIFTQSAFDEWRTPAPAPEGARE